MSTTAKHQVLIVGGGTAGSRASSSRSSGMPAADEG